MTRFVVVTGTDTGVGKTVTTAALAAVLSARARVLVVKPVQTGVGGHSPDPHDVHTVAALAGVEVAEMASLAEPLAPETAAMRADVVLPTVAEHADRIRSLAKEFDVVLVEGAGGLLVRLDRDGATLLDLAALLSAEVVVVCRAGLGTLNHTGLTVAALRSRGIEPAGLVIGSWPSTPGLAEQCNRDDLHRVTGVPVIGVLPEGVGSLDAGEFRAGAPGWVTWSHHHSGGRRPAHGTAASI